MFKKKYIVFPGVPPATPGTWQGNTSDCKIINQKISGMGCYSDYVDRHNEPNCRDYDVTWDWYGPQFFAPS